MKASRFYILLTQLIVLAITAIIILFRHDYNSDNFIFYCRYGTFVCFLSFILLVKLQDKWFTGVNLIFVSFCVFQFGIPMVLSFFPKYSSYYLNLFSYEILSCAAMYSVLSIVVYSFGCSIQLCKNGKSIRKSSWGLKFEKNSMIVCNASFILFLLSAVVFIPVIGVVAFRQLSSGVFLISNRDFTSSNAVLRFVKEYIFSSGLLFLCFNKDIIKKRIVLIIYIFAALIMLALGDRTYGLSALVVLGILLLIYDKSDDAKLDGKRTTGNMRKNILLFVLGIASVYLLVLIAQWRLGVSIKGFSFFDIIFRFFSEMGFNFYSICFVLEFVPRYYPYLLGQSYYGSLVLLIPSTIDFLGLRNYFESIVGEQWLYSALNGRFDFGVGFSLIGESYLNFAWFGIIIIFLYGLLITKFLKDRSNLNLKWDKYIRVVLLLYFLTLPRRSFFSLIKTFEYDILFMGLYLLLMISLSKKNKFDSGMK